MPLFRFRAVDLEERVVSGRVEAPSWELVLAVLSERDLRPTQITLVDAVGAADAPDGEQLEETQKINGAAVHDSQPIDAPDADPD